MATATATAAAGALSLCCSSLTPKLSKLQITTTMTTPLRTNVSFLSNSLSSLTLLNSRRRQLTFSLTPKSTDTDTDTDTEAVAATVVEPETVEEEQPGSVEEGQEPETVEESEVVVEAEEKPKREEVFAVVMVGSRQYIVFPGRYIYTQRLKGASVNDKITLNKVLLVGTKTSTYIGKPIVPNATVEAVVEEQTLDKKVIVFKYKKKKNYRRNIGHRQPITRIRVTSIAGYQDSPAVTLP